MKGLVYIMFAELAQCIAECGVTRPIKHQIYTMSCGIHL